MTAATDATSTIATSERERFVYDVVVEVASVEGVELPVAALGHNPNVDDVARVVDALNRVRVNASTSEFRHEVAFVVDSLRAKLHAVELMNSIRP